jgi:polyisoprenoid-binding protein YceI
MQRKLISAATLLSTLLFTATTTAATSEWTVDPSHTVVGFTIEHMMVSEVDGKFNKYASTVVLDEADFTKSTVEFTIDVASVDTDNADRDKHLVSPDFFDAAKYPQLVFKSRSIAKAANGYTLKGNLSMHGVTKEVSLHAQVSQPVTNPWGKQVRGVKVTGKLNRRDFGLSWNKTLDKGGLALGDEVSIEVKLELNK